MLQQSSELRSDVLRTKEIGPDFQKCQSVINGVSISSDNPLQAGRVTGRKRQSIILTVELATGTQPLCMSLGAIVSMLKRLVDAVMQFRNAPGVLLYYASSFKLFLHIGR